MDMTAPCSTNNNANSKTSSYPSLSSSSSSNCLYYPKSDFSSFHEACIIAATTKKTLYVTPNTNITLHDIVRIKSNQHLHIVGQESSNNNDNNNNNKNNNKDSNSKYYTSTITIQGQVHSLFLGGNSSQLSIENVTLLHNLIVQDHNQVGGAINLRNKATANLVNCTIQSNCGFCIWSVQKIKISLTNCTLFALKRSAMVCFGQAQCQLQYCHIYDAAVHGVCIRGTCQVQMNYCTIQGAHKRAIYAYASAHVTLQHCTITQTKDKYHGAIEVSALQQQQQQQSDGNIPASLYMKDCTITDNNGMGVCLFGQVQYNMDDFESCNTIINNHGKCNTLILLNIQEAMQFVEQQNERNPTIKSSALTTTNNENNNQNYDNQNIMNNNGVIWKFDGDTDKGWIEYDSKSSQLLEAAYQQQHYKNESSAHRHSNDDDDDGDNDDCTTVSLMGGKYVVDLNLMQQVNTETQFMRLVRRQTIPS